MMPVSQHCAGSARGCRAILTRLTPALTGLSPGHEPWPVAATSITQGRAGPQLPQDTQGALSPFKRPQKPGQCLPLSQVCHCQKCCWVRSSPATKEMLSQALTETQQLLICLKFQMALKKKEIIRVYINIFFKAAN